MTEPAEQPPTRSSSTSVVYRHATLVDGADFEVHDDGSVFIALDAPPPVRTVVQLWRGDEARAVVVRRVIEVPKAGSDEARGFFATPADADAIAAATGVGTEHLESATAVDEHHNGTEPGSDGSADGNVAMAMPAPVLIHGDDTSAQLDASTADEADSEATGGAEGPVDTEGGVAAADSATSGDSGDSAGSGEPETGRRRGGRGRKKKKR